MTLKEFNKVLNFMLKMNIITYQEHSDMIRKAIPYLKE